MESEPGILLVVSERWKSTYPGAAIGILQMHRVENPPRHADLDRRRLEFEVNLRERYRGFDRSRLKGLPVMQAYRAYYRAFKKTYHLQHQLESIAIKNKPIPRVAALVEAMFMAELDSLLLTAGHDLDLVQLPVRIDVAHGDEQYQRLNGQQQLVKENDMLIADARGTLSTIIYGPDRHTRIRPETTRVLFTVYAPAGIATAEITQHLKTLEQNVQVIAPRASTEEMQVYGAG